MKTLEANWEDEENNRQIAFAVQYTRKDDAIAIQSLTPKQVTFLCPQTNQPLRSIGVWTDRGRQLLAAQLQASGRLAEVQQELHTGLAV